MDRPPLTETSLQNIVVIIGMGFGRTTLIAGIRFGTAALIASQLAGFMACLNLPCSPASPA